MDRKASAFVAAFGATLFAQWAAEPRVDEELFWADASALQRTLEDGIAKLPQPKLQAALRRDLARFLAQLQTLLQEKHRDYELQNKKMNKKANKKSSETQSECVSLLNEADVERALATETDAAVASVLAREDVLDAVRLQQAATTATTAAELVGIAGECAERLRVVRARLFESASERDGVVAFYWTLIHSCAANAMQRWCDDGSRGLWCVLVSTASERETLRRVLQSLVVADALAPAPQEPWSAFFRPAPHKMFRSLDLVQARASVYGALLSLAVSFPVVYDDDEDEEDATSDSSSSDSDSDSDSDIDSPTNRHAAEFKKQQQRNKRDHQDCGTLAAHVVRQIVLSAKRESDEREWYLAVLKAFHRLATPTQFATDDDEDEEALTRHQQATLHDARAELYARAFASSSSLWTSLQQDPLAVLETLLCLRHASEFLRVERKQTIAPVATATSQLAGVPLPSAFWQWLAHVKKVFAGQEPVVQRVMKKLAKHKTSDQKTKMANVLMHDSVVTLSELRVVVEQFSLYLEMEKERSHFVVARGGGGEAPPLDDEDAPDQALFFQDHDGGRSKKRTPVEEREEGATKRGRTDA